MEVGKLDGQQKRLPARVVRFPHFDPEKTAGTVLSLSAGLFGRGLPLDRKEGLHRVVQRFKPWRVMHRRQVPVHGDLNALLR